MSDNDWNIAVDIVRSQIKTTAQKVAFMNQLRKSLSDIAPKNKAGAAMISDFDLLFGMSTPTHVREAVIQAMQKVL